MNDLLSVGVIHFSASLYQLLAINNLFYHRGLCALWGGGVEDVGGVGSVVLVKRHGDEFGGGIGLSLQVSYASGKSFAYIAEETVEREVVLVATKGVDGAIGGCADA